MKLTKEERIELCQNADFLKLLENDGKTIEKSGDHYVCKFRNETGPSCHVYPPGTGAYGDLGWNWHDHGQVVSPEQKHGDALAYLIDICGYEFPAAVQSLRESESQSSRAPGECSTPVKQKSATVVANHKPGDTSLLAEQRNAVCAFLAALTKVNPESTLKGNEYLNSRGIAVNALVNVDYAYRLNQSDRDALLTELRKSNLWCDFIRFGLVEEVAAEKHTVLWRNDTILFACCDQIGMPTYLVGRQISKDAEPRYIKQATHSKQESGDGGARVVPFGLPCLYSESGRLSRKAADTDFVDEAHRQSLFIVEGTTDVLAARSRKIPAMAMLGSLRASRANAMLGDHLEALRALRNVFVLPDSDVKPADTQEFVDWLRCRDVNASQVSMDFVFPDRQIKGKDLAEAVVSLGGNTGASSAGFSAHVYRILCENALLQAAVNTQETQDHRAAVRCLDEFFVVLAPLWRKFVKPRLEQNESVSWTAIRNELQSPEYATLLALLQNVPDSGLQVPPDIEIITDKVSYQDEGLKPLWDTGKERCQVRLHAPWIETTEDAKQRRGNLVKVGAGQAPGLVETGDGASREQWPYFPKFLAGLIAAGGPCLDLSPGIDTTNGVPLRPLAHIGLPEIDDANPIAVKLRLDLPADYIRYNYKISALKHRDNAEAACLPGLTLKLAVLFFAHLPRNGEHCFSATYREIVRELYGDKNSGRRNYRHDVEAVGAAVLALMQLRFQYNPNYGPYPVFNIERRRTQDEKDFSVYVSLTEDFVEAVSGRGQYKGVGGFFIVKMRDVLSLPTNSPALTATALGLYWYWSRAVSGRTIRQDSFNERIAGSKFALDIGLLPPEATDQNGRPAPASNCQALNRMRSALKTNLNKLQEIGIIGGFEATKTSRIGDVPSFVAKPPDDWLKAQSCSTNKWGREPQAKQGHKKTRKSRIKKRE